MALNNLVNTQPDATTSYFNNYYVPDFFIIYQDARGQNHAEMIEIKPEKETHLSEAKSSRDRASIAVNWSVT